MNSLNFEESDFSKIPFKNIVKLGQRSMIRRKLFSVSWILGRYCNYNCSYCWPYAHSQKPDHRPIELIKETMNKIKKQARENGFDAFHFSFSGGEPTFHPNYFEIIENYKNDLERSTYQSLHMTTNLSRSINWLKKYVEITKELSRVSVTASFHIEFANTDKFKEKLIFLQQNDIHVTVNMVMSLENFSALWKYALELHAEGINVTLKPQSNSTATKVIDGYTEEQLRILKNGLPQRDYTSLRLKSIGKKSDRIISDNKTTSSLANKNMQIEMQDDQGQTWYLDQAERFNAFNFNNFKGWKCNAGFQSLIIREPDGAIKRSYSCSDEPIGYIDSDFNIFNAPKECITPHCVSSADSKIPKMK